MSARLWRCLRLMQDQSVSGLTRTRASLPQFRFVLLANRADGRPTRREFVQPPFEAYGVAGAPRVRWMRAVPKCQLGYSTVHRHRRSGTDATKLGPCSQRPGRIPENRFNRCRVVWRRMQLCPMQGAAVVLRFRANSSWSWMRVCFGAGFRFVPGSLSVAAFLCSVRSRAHTYNVDSIPTD